MEWMNRGVRPAAPANQAVPGAVPGQPQTNKKPGRFKPMRIATGVLIITGALLLVSLAAYLLVNGTNSNAQAKYVDSKNMQAVFLNGGQVYFGNINALNNDYVKLSNIYYLRVNQQVQPNGTTASNQDISLVKLGCELHGPQDSMIVNQSQVIFWENLKSDGQVAKAVADYVKQNPDGQKCETTSSNNAGAANTATGSNTNTTNKNQ